MGPVPLFVELCAGTAALSLRLHARGARPPVSRMGAKTGYADAILRVLGLAPGARAAHYLWCEPDPGVRLLLEAYRDADLARSAAAIIRSWSDEEPRALWERLRAEGPPRLPATGPEVARWAVVGAWSFRRGEPESGYAPRAEPRVGSGGYLRNGTDASLNYLQGAIDAAPTLPATIATDARTVDPPALPPGTIAYLDGPYQGTTPYAHDLPRAEQVTLARRWQAAGAVVCISEAEPIPELTADGWHAVRIDGERQGQKRTFSKQQAEWLTLSHPPAWRPSVQAGLFA